MSSERKRGDDGFTLIEVLIAMVILAVGLLALEAMGIGAARMVARADRQSEHVARATARIEMVERELRRNNGVASAASQQAVTLTDGAVMTTTITGRSTDVAPDNELYAVRVKVTPRATDKALSVKDTLSLRTNVFIP